MNKFLGFMEKRFVPVAAKIGSNRFLVSIRDAFIAMLPLVLTGSIAVLLNALFRDIPTAFGWTKFVDNMSWLISINGNVWWGTLAMFSVFFSFSFGYQLCKNYDVDAFAGGLIGLTVFLVSTPQSHGGNPWGYLNNAYLGVTSLFVSIILVALSSYLFILLARKNITIRMPDSVPPAVSRAFTALIPAAICIFAIATITYLFGLFTDTNLHDFVTNFVQKPTMSVSQNFFFVLGTAFFVQLLWFFGLHGTAVLGVIVDGIYGTAIVENVNNAALGQAMEYMWTKTSFDVFVWMGGAGCAIALVAAILVFSKKKGERAVTKMSAPMCAFNINEPITFGLPIVLNPIYFIPFIIIPPILTIVAFFFTSVGWVPATSVAVPWITPPIIGAIIATKSVMGGVVAIINLAIAFAIWSIFVIIGNKIRYNTEGIEVETVDGDIVEVDPEQVNTISTNDDENNFKQLDSANEDADVE